MDHASNRFRTLAYWATTVVVAVLFAVPGTALVLRVPHFVSEMAHLGYPEYFLGILGPWKVLGAIVILVPRFQRLKEWAYAGMIIDATAAAVSRAAVHDGAITVIAPVFIGILVLASWALRPRSERALELSAAS